MSCCNDVAKYPVKVCVAFDADCQSNGNSTDNQPNGESIAKELEALKKEIESNKNEIESLKKEVEKPNNDASYFLCEFYHFRNPVLHKGFELAHGGIIEDAAMRYPQAWAFLQTDEGKAFCLEEAAWQEMNHSVWHTLADETKVGFEGIGGAPFYVQDLNAGTLRLPDIRGMYAEAAGFDELKVGGVHGDMVRNATGEAGLVTYGCFTHVSGVFDGIPRETTTAFSFGEDKVRTFYKRARFNMANSLPTGNAIKPRAYGLLPCVYLGNAS